MITKSNRESLFLFLLFFGIAAGLPAQDLLVCDFTGTAPGANTPWTATTALAPDLDFSGWSLGAGSFGQGDIDDAFGYRVNAPGDPESSLAMALAEDEYIGFTLTPTGATTLDLSGLEVTLGIQRASWHSPRRYALFTSVGGFAEGAQIFRTPRFESGDESETTFRFFFPLAGYDGLAGPVEFRLYAYAANYNHPTRLTAFSIGEFAGNVYALDLSAAEGGSVFAVPDSTLHREGAEVRISATPEPGFRFAGWSGDLSGFGNPVTVSMETDKSIAAEFAPNPPPGMKVGTNLSAVVDWATHWAFVDLFQRSREWRTRNADGSGGWDSNLYDAIPTDADGWPAHVPFDPGGGNPRQIVHTVILNLPVAGTYKLLYEGTGRMRVTSQGWQTIDATGGPGSFDLVAGDDADIFLEIHESAAADPLRHLRLVMPGFLDTYATEPFHPLFLERLAPFTNLRFMDWARTNASPLAAWSERTTPGSSTQAREEGVALEYMVQLASTLGVDPWICIPHAADDNYVRECARLLRDAVEPDRRIYVEYSNETWNTAGPFSQTIYCMDQGEALGLSADRWQAGQRFVALRSVQIWEIFEEEFADDSRLVKVMATQSANPSVTRLRRDALNDPAINPDRTMPHTLAVAPYFGGNYSPADIAQNGYPTVDDILETRAPQVIEWTRGTLREQKRIADEQGWELICYEGGQHFVGVAGAENDNTLTAILIAANRDPRMYGLYRDYLDMLKEEGVTLFANFSMVSEPSKWGSWGVLEYQDQPIAEAHKYRALVDWIAAQGEPPAAVTGWRAY